jgi:methyl-accepting chemotaxis protein
MKDPAQTVPKSFLSGFVFKSALIFAGGALLTAAVFYLALREQGASYADSYRLLADLDRVLVNKSLMLFSFTLLLSIAGIIILAIVYSHRVAGALHKLGMHTRRIASGDLAAAVRLRRTDVVHELADDFNDLSGRYRDVLGRLDSKTRELAAIMEDLEKHPPAAGDAGPTAKISERTDEIRELLRQIKL